MAPSYVAVVTKVIQDQLSDYKAHTATFLDDESTSSPEDVIVKGSLEEKEASWWETWRTKVRSEGFAKLPDEPEQHTSRKRRKVVKDEAVEPQVVPPAVLGEQPMSLDEFEEDDSLALEEMRILIKVRFITISV